jgi:hypothetical protein
LSGDCVRLSLYTETQVKLDFLVVTNRTAIVATMVALLGSCSFIQTKNSAIVKTKVRTISAALVHTMKPASDALRL